VHPLQGNHGSRPCRIEPCALGDRLLI
jgi:hypothetical protein